MIQQNERLDRTRRSVMTALLAAVIFLLSFTPIGFVNLVIIKATIVHIPVIIGSMLLGPKVGALLGFCFGLTSFINNTLAPTAIMSPMFSPLVPMPGTDHGTPWALVVCFVPRILVGVVPAYVERWLSALLSKPRRRGAIPLFLSGFAGSMTNTLLVMHLIYLLFRDVYADRTGTAVEAVYTVITSIIIFQGLPEAIVAGVLTAAAGKLLATTGLLRRL